MSPEMLPEDTFGGTTEDRIDRLKIRIAVNEQHLWDLRQKLVAAEVKLEEAKTKQKLVLTCQDDGNAYLDFTSDYRTPGDFLIAGWNQGGQHDGQEVFFCMKKDDMVRLHEWLGGVL